MQSSEERNVLRIGQPEHSGETELTPRWSMGCANALLTRAAPSPSGESRLTMSTRRADGFYRTSRPRAEQRGRDSARRARRRRSRIGKVALAQLPARASRTRSAGLHPAQVSARGTIQDRRFRQLSLFHGRHARHPGSSRHVYTNARTRTPGVKATRLSIETAAP